MLVVRENFEKELIIKNPHRQKKNGWSWCSGPTCLTFGVANLCQVLVASKLAKALPKTELHLHLDGSITTDFIIEAAA
eukprot:SAG31_NODE_14956_length_778_cov_1.435935_1_plen_77_part_01